MSDSHIKEFPEISSKLSAAAKKSVFERQRAEAEAKRQREEAETAAVYEDFVKSFDDEGNGPSLGAAKAPGGARKGPGLAAAGPGAGGPAKRHFTTSGPRASGPGSLGPVLGSSGRKRAHDGTLMGGRERDHGLFAYENSASGGPIDAATAFKTSDDEDEAAHSAMSAEKAAPKPTLHLSSLPPGTSPAVIKSLLPSWLTVDGVRSLPPSARGSTERKSISAIVTLAKDTPASEIDTAVNGLQNRYLGWGFYLSLSRHLSSAALGSGVLPSGLSSLASSSLPFGARTLPQGPAGGALNRAPPPSSHHRGGYAPPSSFAPTGPGQFNRVPPAQVVVAPPSDLKQLKLIHRTLEALLTHGPEFEALLMSRHEVQRDAKWVWLWDARSVGGVWYRWRLWDILTGPASTARGPGRGAVRGVQKVFDGGVLWSGPEKGLPFEYTTRFDGFVSDADYDSSEDEDSGDEAARRKRDFNRGGGPAIEGGAMPPAEEKSYLNPLQKAKLTHLLARLPITTAKLRKGDVARVTAFAISHAGEGADEVVDMIVSNVEKPYSWTAANPENKRDGTNNSEQDRGRGDGELQADEKDKEKDGAEREDTSLSTLIALYVISDILSSSSTSGVRHAWRYRQLFEGAIRERKIFEKLGAMEKGRGWGRLKAEKWRRSIGGLLALWEGWCVFPQVTWEEFSEGFKSAVRGSEKEEEASGGVKSVESTAKQSRWKSLGVGERRAAKTEVASEEDVDGEPMLEDEDVDGEPMLEDEDVDGEPMAEEEFDGEAVEKEGHAAPAEGAEDSAEQAQELLNSTPAPTAEGQTAAARLKRMRPKAEDMFADSDDE